MNQCIATNLNFKPEGQSCYCVNYEDITFVICVSGGLYTGK